MNSLNHEKNMGMAEDRSPTCLIEAYLLIAILVVFLFRVAVMEI